MCFGSIENPRDAVQRVTSSHNRGLPFLEPGTGSGSHGLGRTVDRWNRRGPCPAIMRNEVQQIQGRAGIAGMFGDESGEGSLPPKGGRGPRYRSAAVPLELTDDGFAGKPAPVISAPVLPFILDRIGPARANQVAGAG